MRALTFLARRFVAGDTLEEAMEVVRRLNGQGFKVTLDHLGEETRLRGQAGRDVYEYARMLQAINDAGADCNVSLKLTQLGLSLDPTLARENLERILEEARRHKNFVRIDMEGSAYTQGTLDLFYELWPKYPNMGVVIQAMLRRSRADIEKLVQKGVRVRLCKGAYKEPKPVAFQNRAEVNASYDELAELLTKAPCPGFATHDDDRILHAQQAAAKRGLAKGSYEFQMLYGLRQRRWAQLRDDGHAVRIYVPYGTHWLPYFVRRLRERKENVMFVVRGLWS